jgi:ferredoxin-type protein NapG
MTEAPHGHRLRRLVKPAAVPRRRFLAQGAVLLGAGALALHFGVRRRREDVHARVFIRPGTLPIRPPGARDDDDDFRAACVRCGLCANVCDAGCIRFFGADESEHGALTPYLDVRQRSCTLCMKCTQVCPSGALLPIARAIPDIRESVRMGTAVVDPERCISYLGRVCGYCHDACPLPNIAIRLLAPATPLVVEEGCVGCGRCVEHCPQTPTAISVVRSVA